VKRRVVITGIGVVTPIGCEKEKFWHSSLEGRSGVCEISRFNTDSYTTKIAAEVKDFEPTEYIPEDRVMKLNLASQFGIAATLMAVKDAHLNLEKEDRDRIGVSMASGMAAMFVPEDQLLILYDRAQGNMTPLLEHNIISNQISTQLEVSGPSITISTACSAGNQAVGHAFNLIRLDKNDVMIAGGAEAPILPLIMAAFCTLRVMSKCNDEPEKASRPFDKGRDGFVMGEGAGVVVLESLEHALNRNARIYTEVVGFGATCDAYHMVMPDPDQAQVVKAMNLALKDASLSPSDVDYINAHGTSTQKNDFEETKAIKMMFSDHAYKLAISSTKSMIGHTICAAGAIELIVCALAIENGIIPPTINYENPDPKCDLDYVPNIPREREVNVALSNAFGFGGNNASVILKKYQG